jgi:hypothetical protein
LKNILLHINSKQNSLLLFILSSLVILVGQYNHELWIDEWQAFQLTKAARNPFHLYQLRTYEGHPYLYFFIIYLGTLISKSLLVFKSIHFLFCVATMYLLLVKLPLSFLQKTLLLTSYYFIWEYVIFNRCYIVAVFFILLFAYKLLQDRFSVLYMLLLIVAIIHTSAYSAVFAPGLLFLWVHKYRPTKQAIIIYALFLIGNFILFYWSVAPSSNNVVHINWAAIIENFSINTLFYKFLLGVSTRYFAPPPANIFGSGISEIIYVLSMFGFFILTVVTIARFHFKLAYISVISGLIILNAIFSTSGYRHLGFYFIAYLCFYLISNGARKKLELISSFPLIFILILQSWEGISSYKRDCSGTFSNSVKVANYLKQNGFDIYPNVGYYAYAINSISGYTNKPIIPLHCLHLHTYCINNKEEFNEPVSQNLDSMYLNMNKAFAQNGPFVFILNNENFCMPLKNTLDSISLMNNCVIKMPEFNGAICQPENYYLFHVKNYLPVLQ